MLKKAIKRNIIIFSVFLMAFLFGGNVLAADNTTNTTSEITKYGLLETKTAIGDSSLTTYKDAPTLVGQLIGVALSLLGILFLVLMIYGGFLWMTARGDGGQIDSAKGLMTAAVIGLIIVLSAYAITYFIGSNLAGTTTTTSSN